MAKLYTALPRHDATLPPKLHYMLKHSGCLHLQAQEACVVRWHTHFLPLTPYQMPLLLRATLARRATASK